MAKKILVVDDEPNIVDVISTRLKANNYEVVAACDGLQALELAKKERPDLVILDLMLPKMDGYQVCNQLKSEDDLKDIPIIMLTSLGKANEIKEGLDKGADAYVAKPFN
ncbi:MAG: response regulator, partial [Candidatus Omnitrophota bacterium]